MASIYRTEFADQRAAYDALSENMKMRIENLVAEHWAFHSRNMLGGGDFTAEGMAKLPPVEWPIVDTVPESNRKTLFIGVHTREIRNMPRPRPGCYYLICWSTQLKESSCTTMSGGIMMS